MQKRLTNGELSLACFEMAAFGQHAARRLEDEIVQLLVERKADEHADADADDRSHDALPELVEMLQKRHLSGGR